MESSSYTLLPLDSIVDKLHIRRLSAKGVARIQESMRWAGFLENYPLTVRPMGDGNYQRLDGNHRYAAAKALGISPIPCVIKTDISEQECYQLAMQSNNAAESIVPFTLVTYAEFIWERLSEEDERGKKKYTQSDVGEMLGWSRESIKDFVALQKICPSAWDIIGATFEKNAPTSSDNLAPEIGAIAPIFTEGLLRSIVHLTSEQQLELVQDLTQNKIEKSAFTRLAKAYRYRNEMNVYALEQLRGPGEQYITRVIDAIGSGAYDSEWQSDKEHKNHPKLDKLIQSLYDEWEQKSSYRLIYGDFREEVQKIEDGSVDLILTDPPYNIARENEFELDGRSNISQDFGEWDKHEHHTFINDFALWSKEWARILRDQGSGYVFTSDRYISYLRTALESTGLHVKATIIWHKTNPGTQVVKTNFRSSVEYILFFTKGEGGHTFNWQGENEMHNFIERPICAGRERLVDAKGKTLHPTQKPESVLEHFMKISSNQGDMVFDGFAGVFTTCKVAKDLGRKSIGIEQDTLYFEAGKRRMED